MSDLLNELRYNYIELLLKGNRDGCREMLLDALHTGTPASDLLLEIIWKAMDYVDECFREDTINFVTEHMATRINRSLADQLQPHLPIQPRTDKKMIICCSDEQGHELGAQIMADLFEADGWEVWFVGSGVPMDELVQLVGRLQPELLVYFGTEPGGIPEVRKTLYLLHRMGSSPHTAVLACGGVFNRAEGLWIEVGADTFAPDARTAVELARDGVEIRQHFVQIEGEPKRRRKRKTLLSPAQ